MNIFYLHKNPVTAAEMSCDKHVVKMILESAQLLSTCHRVQDATNTMTRQLMVERLKDGDILIVIWKVYCTKQVG